MFYFGKMLGNVCQMECRNVCQITCHKKRFVRSYDVRKYAMVGLFFGRKSFGVSWPHPPHLTEATAGSASTAHPADAAHAPRCTSRSGALSWNLRSNGSWAPQTPGRQLKVRKAWGTNRISIPFVIGHNSQHGVQLARTFLMSSNHYIYYNNIYMCNSPLTWFGGTTYETSICGLWSSCCEISSQCTVDLRWAPPQKVDLATKDKPFSMGI
jgi:hypothetical protein